MYAVGDDTEDMHVVILTDGDRAEVWILWHKEGLVVLYSKRFTVNSLLMEAITMLPLIAGILRSTTRISSGLIPAPIVDMMRFLNPYDFELLVELVFAQSGWQRISSSGGTQKTIDLELYLPSTKDYAFVQVKIRNKSKTVRRV